MRQMMWIRMIPSKRTVVVAESRTVRAAKISYRIGGIGEQRLNRLMCSNKLNNIFCSADDERSVSVSFRFSQNNQHRISVCVCVCARTAHQSKSNHAVQHYLFHIRQFLSAQNLSIIFVYFYSFFQIRFIRFYYSLVFIVHIFVAERWIYTVWASQSLRNNNNNKEKEEEKEVENVTNMYESQNNSSPTIARSREYDRSFGCYLSLLWFVCPWLGSAWPFSFQCVH